MVPDATAADTSWLRGFESRTAPVWPERIPPPLEFSGTLTQYRTTNVLKGGQLQ